MIITILGSGTCVPSLERASSSIWVRFKKTEILLDMGTGCTRRLMEAGGDPKDIDSVFLSHFHPDHTSELVSFLFSLKYGEILKKDKSFTLMGGNGFNSFYNSLLNVYGKWIDCNGRLEIKELGPGSSLTFKDLKLETFHVNHRQESLAVKITDLNNKSMVFSGDMDETSGFDEFCRGADLLVIESAFPDNMKKKGHLTPSLAAETARKAGVKTLVLTHFYPECKTDDFLKNALKIFKGRIITATDLMEIKL